MPMLHIISHYGILCSFDVINITQGATQICSPPEPVSDRSGLMQFIIPHPVAPQVAVVASQPLAASLPVATNQPFGGTFTVASPPFGVSQPVASPPVAASMQVPPMQQVAASQPAPMPNFGSFGISTASPAPNTSIPTTTPNKPSTMVSKNMF